MPRIKGRSKKHKRKSEKEQNYFKDRNMEELEERDLELKNANKSEILNGACVDDGYEN